MSWKALAVVQFVLTLLLGAALLSQYVSVKTVNPVVREPAAPGESTLAYTPPPPPKIALEALRDLSELKKAMTPQVDKITEDIYQASGFALGNVQMVITDEGLVIIDTTESQDAAREIFARFREITDQPVRVSHLHPRSSRPRVRDTRLHGRGHRGRRHPGSGPVYAEGLLEFREFHVRAPEPVRESGEGVSRATCQSVPCSGASVGRGGWWPTSPSRATSHSTWAGRPSSWFTRGARRRTTSWSGCRKSGPCSAATCTTRASPTCRRPCWNLVPSRGGSSPSIG